MKSDLALLMRIKIPVNRNLACRYFLCILFCGCRAGSGMCLAQQNSDGEESHDGLADEKSAQIAADAVDRKGKQHKEDADAAGNQIQHESDARVAEPVQNTAQRHAEVQERTDPAERPYKCSGERVPKKHIPDKVTGSKKTRCTKKAPQKTDPDGF